MAYDCKCFDIVSLPVGAIGWSAVCDWCSSCSCSLTFYCKTRKDTSSNRIKIQDTRGSKWGIMISE